MKFEVKADPVEGDTRIVRKFAWWPFRSFDLEAKQTYVVWLETYDSHQQYQSVLVSKWGLTEIRWVEQYRTMLWPYY